jgi:hypothetical protein
MIQRLRPAYTETELAHLYQKPHEHRQWRDHIHRVNMTIAMAKWWGELNSIADLACGDGAIIDALDARVKYKGDFAPGYEIVGALEETIHQIPVVDLFICSETIEHLDKPFEALKLIRAKSRHLILTTPNGESDSNNPQHYWGWDMAGMGSMLEEAGWNIEITTLISFKDKNLIYDYQMWGCS